MTQKKNKDELALREFHSVALAKNISFVDQVSMLLKQGCDYLSMRCGIVSYVEGDRYTVLHVYTNAEEYKILSGDVFDFGITYCKFTMQQKVTVGFHHAANSEVAKHPSYEALKLEAYLGAPTYLNNEVFGTVNFTSIEPRETEFTESEKYYVNLIADWFSAQLDEHYQKQPALESHTEIASRLKNSSHAIIEFSEEYKVSKWSDSATDMLGWQGSQVINKSPIEWPGVDAADLQDLMHSLKQVNAANKDGYAFYSELIKNNGDSISTEWFVSHVVSSSGEMIIRAHILDITEHVHVEDELLRKNARYLDLYENAPDMYLSLVQSGNIISANKLCYQILGYDQQALLGKPYWNLILKSELRRIKRLIDVAFTGDVSELEMEVCLLTRSGDQIRTHQKISIIQAKKGMPRELRIIARDITERKRGQVTRLLHMQQQRDEISHEVQHRIKNSLQAVIGLLTMNMDSSPELKPILTNSISQVNTISIVNGLILDGKEDIEITSLLDALQKASSKLFNYQVKFTVMQNTNSRIMLVGEEVIAVSLIYSELLINAFKHHSQNSSGENFIAISIVLNEKAAVIEVTNTQNKLCLKANDDSNFGQSMINSLLPPIGAVMKVESNEMIYRVVCSLSEPVVVYEAI